jgi:hypothetical protein
MIEFDRDFFKNDPVFIKLFEVIKANHKVADHTTKVLLENKAIENFCEEATHFSVLGGKGDPIYISYDVTTSLKNDRAAVTIDKIIVYDSLMEYNAAHVNGKYSGNFTQQPIKGGIKK